MDQDELLRYLAEALGRLEIEYLITGSTATIYYGEPRFTNDIDVVVRLREEHLRRLSGAFPAEDFYFSEETARRALATGGMFNILHPRSGLKVDFVVASSTDFDRSRFERARRLRPAAGYEATFAAPEDVILKKLVFYREGGSDKHLRDVAGVLKISGDDLDLDYLDAWAERLGVADLWQRVRARVERPE